jgi:hypothetical protein
MRGDAVIYLWNETDVPGALGYHFQNARGIPFGIRVHRSCAEHRGAVAVTLSHEALELRADPETNLLVMGPHPMDDRDVFHWFEMCDAVQAESYDIDGVSVSNFVLPLYFTGTRDTDEVGARNDFLGRSYGGQTLKSFGINPGGYVGFFDPQLGDHDTYSIKGDAVAGMRFEMKARAKEARRSVRYRSFGGREKLREAAEAVPSAVRRTKPSGARAAFSAAARGRQQGRRGTASLREQLPRETPAAMQATRLRRGSTGRRAMSGAGKK